MNVELDLENIQFDTLIAERDREGSGQGTNESLNSEKESNKSLNSENESNKTLECKKKSRCINDTYYWEQIGDAWKTKLGSDKFMIKNCLGDGNCQFRSIENALTNAGYKTNYEKLRQKIAKYINGLDNSSFIDIVKIYQIEKQNGEFVGNWDPFKIKNKRDFVKIIKTPGFDFQGDFITLELMSKAISMDIIIFTSDLDIINLSDADKLQDKIIILYYDKINNGYGHYQTIGLKKKSGAIETIFKRSKLPEEIDRILDRHSFLLFHIKSICDNGTCGTSHMHLNYILKTLESRLGVKMSRNDKLIIMKITRTFLEKRDYFNKINIK